MDSKKLRAVICTGAKVRSFSTSRRQLFEIGGISVCLPEQANTVKLCKSEVDSTNGLPGGRSRRGLRQRQCGGQRSLVKSCFHRQLKCPRGNPRAAALSCRCRKRSSARYPRPCLQRPVWAAKSKDGVTQRTALCGMCKSRRGGRTVSARLPLRRQCPAQGAVPPRSAGRTAVVKV